MGWGARACGVAALVVISGVCAVISGCRRDRVDPGIPSGGGPTVSSAAAAVAAAPLAAAHESRGIWLWKTRELLAQEGAAAAIASACRTGALNEVYVSVGEDRLRDPRFVPFVT